MYITISFLYCKAEYFGEEELRLLDRDQPTDISTPSTSAVQPELDDKFTDKFGKKTHFVDSLLRSDIVSKSTTESSVTTVISTLTKSSDEDHKSVLEDATSADLSKISGADLVKDPSKTSFDAKEDSKIEEQGEDRGTPDLSKKSVDLTKDYSKSSIDSKDTSRDFATNELSKDSTVDLSKDFSKASVESVKETSKSIDEKTFSEDHSSLDVSKTLASDASEGITVSKEFIEEERSVSRIVRVSTSSSQSTSVLTESKLFSEIDDKSLDKIKNETEPEKDFIGEMEEQIAHLKSEYKKEEDSDKATDSKKILDKVESKIQEKATLEDNKDVIQDALDKDMEDEVPDMKELNRRCSNLLEDISQGALIRIDSSHVTHGKLYLTPQGLRMQATLY